MSTWTITSGEGEIGTEEDYNGRLSLRAMRARLTKETCGGDRWAFFACDGERVDLDDVEVWTPDRSPTGHATAVKGGHGPHYVSKDMAIAAARKMWRCNNQEIETMNANEIYENRYETRDQWIITTRDDLATYLADVRMDLLDLDDRYFDAVLDQLQFMDHPAWGDDWAEWLSEVTDIVCAEVTADVVLDGRFR